jgi:copper chaperone
MKRLLLALIIGGFVSALTARADENTATLKVKGMTCQACVSKVAKSLKAVEGVKDAKVSLDKEQAVVTYDADKVKPAKLIAAVKDSGFKAEQASKYKCEGCGKGYDTAKECCGAPAKRVE